jgi:hypothetical protein
MKRGKKHAQRLAMERKPPVQIIWAATMVKQRRSDHG